MKMELIFQDFWKKSFLSKIHLSSISASKMLSKSASRKGKSFRDISDKSVPAPNSVWFKLRI